MDNDGKVTILEMCDEEGLLLGELAELLEVSEAAVWNWITTGRIGPTSMQRLCDLFELDESEWDLQVGKTDGPLGKTWTRTTITHESYTVSEEGRERWRRGQRIRYERLRQNSIEENT